MSEWQTVKLGNITTKIGSGATPRGGKEAYKTNGIKLIRSLNVYDFYFDYSGLAFIDDEQADGLSNVVVESQDILLNITGASVARCCMVPDNILPARVNQHVAIVRVNKEKATPQFVFYVLVSPTYKHHLLSLAQGGATREALTKSTIEDFEIPLPSLEIQHKIAAILSAYDDLIENNTRRIKALEQAAHDLYREWFVEFRFPGYESVEMVDSGTDYGMIPRGWEVRSVDKSFDILGGGTPSTKNPEYWEDGDIVWFSPSDLTASKAMFISDSSKHINAVGLQKSSAKMFPAYSVMMTSRATLGVTAINTVPACTNQGFITCLPNENVTAYQIYFWIAENLEKIISVASGATFKEINKTTFRQFPFIIPDADTTSRFATIAEPIGKQIENLLRRNHALCEARDLLLPRLVSGQLDVSDVEVGVNI